MILQKIKKLCKACGTIVIVNRSDGSQWLGTPSAIYPVFGINLTPDSVCALFDITSEREAYNFLTLDETDLERHGCSLSDTDHREAHLSPFGLTLSYSGMELCPLISGDGFTLQLIPDYLEPLKEYSERSLWLRGNEHSGYYIAVKSGYQIIAVLASEKLPEWVADKLSIIYKSAMISHGAESFDRGRLIPYEPDREEASENV